MNSQLVSDSKVLDHYGELDNIHIFVYGIIQR